MKTSIKKIVSFLVVGIYFSSTTNAMPPKGDNTQPEGDPQVTEENSINTSNQEPQFCEEKNDIFINSCDSEGDVTIPEKYQNNSKALFVNCDVKNLNLENSCFTFIITPNNHTIKNITFSENNKAYKLSQGLKGSDIVNKDSGKLIFLNPGNVLINNESQFYPIGNAIVISACDSEGNVTIPERYQNKSEKLFVDCDVKNLNLENSCFTLIAPLNNHTIKNITFSEDKGAYELSFIGSHIKNKVSDKYIFFNPGNVSINNKETIYTHNKKFIDLLQTDEEGLKHYINVKIDKHSAPNDKKNYKNLSKEDHLMIKREVVSILNEKFETGLNKEEIMMASDEQCELFLQRFSAYKKRDKAKAIYDWITKNIKYDRTQLKEEKFHLKNSAAQTFKDRKGICQGFAQLSKLMMRLAGVPCLRTIGNNHSFNYIYIEDSESDELDWILMDTASGSSQVIDFVDEKDPSKGTEIKSKEDNGNYLPDSKSESIDLINNSSSYSISQFSLFSTKSLEDFVRFEIFSDIKKIYIVPLFNPSNQIKNLENLNIPDELNNFFDYRLLIDKSIKIKNLNLGNSSLEYIEDENVDNITVSDSNLKYKNVNGIMINDNEKIIFSKQFKEIVSGMVNITSCDPDGNVTIPKVFQNWNKELFIECDIKTLNLGSSICDFSIYYGHSVDEITVSDSNPKYKNVNGTIINKDNEKIVFSKQFEELGSEIVKITSCDPDGNLTIPEVFQNWNKKLFIDCDIKTLNLGSSTCDFFITSGHSVDEFTVSDNNPKYENVNGDIINKETREIVLKKNEAAK